MFSTELDALKYEIKFNFNINLTEYKKISNILPKEISNKYYTEFEKIINHKKYDFLYIVIHNYINIITGYNKIYYYFNNNNIYSIIYGISTNNDLIIFFNPKEDLIIECLDKLNKLLIYS